MPRCRRGPATLLWLSVSTLASVAAAEPPSSVMDSLRVQSRCVTRERIGAAISRQFGGRALDPRITAVVEDDADLADVSVIFIKRDGEIVGERRIGPLACSDRSEAVAAALLVAVEAVLVLPEKTPPPREETPLVAPPPQEPAVKADDAYPKLGGSLQVLGLLGVVPKPTVGAAAALETSLARHLDARVSAAAALPTRSEIGPGQVDVTWVSVRLDACAVASPRSSVRLRACAGTAVGALLARGTGFSPSYSATPAWIAGMLRGDARVALSGAIGLFGSIEAVIPFVRPDLEIASGAGAVSERLSVPAVGGILGTGVDFR